MEAGSRRIGHTVNRPLPPVSHEVCRRSRVPVPREIDGLPRLGIPV